MPFRHEKKTGKKRGKCVSFYILLYCYFVLGEKKVRVAQLLQREHFRSPVDMQAKSLCHTGATPLMAAEDSVIGAEFISPQERAHLSLRTSVVFRSRSHPNCVSPARAATQVASWYHLQSWGHTGALLTVHIGESIGCRHVRSQCGLPISEYTVPPKLVSPPCGRSSSSRLSHLPCIACPDRLPTSSCFRPALPSSIYPTLQLVEGSVC